MSDTPRYKVVKLIHAGHGTGTTVHSAEPDHMYGTEAEAVAAARQSGDSSDIYAWFEGEPLQWVRHVTNGK